MWNVTRTWGNAFYESLDTGIFFRRPALWLYAIAAAALAVGMLVLVAAILYLTGVSLYAGYANGAHSAAVRAFACGLFLASGLVFTGVFTVRHLWLRLRDLRSRGMDGGFVMAPLLAHQVRTFGETVGLLIGLAGIICALALWPMSLEGMVAVDLPLAGAVRSAGFLLLLLAPLAPVAGFLIVAFFRWLSEVIRVLYTIANNTRRGTAVADDVAAPMVAPPRVDGGLLLIAVLGYLMLMLPFSLAMPLLPCVALLILALQRGWSRALPWLVAVALIMGTGALIAWAASGDPQSLGAYFFRAAQPLLIVLFLIGCVAVVLAVLHRTGRWARQGRPLPAILGGIAIAAIFFIRPVADTIMEAGRRHVLSPAELAQARGLLKDYQGRAFCLAERGRYDTTSAFTIDTMEVNADLYGNIRYRHRLDLREWAGAAVFKGTYADIRLPDDLFYISGRDTLRVRYMDGDSLRILHRGRAHQALAVDAIAAHSKAMQDMKDRAFVAYRDSLNRYVDTLTGTFDRYECDSGPCFAWFRVEQNGGTAKRPFFCLDPIIGGYPLQGIPADRTKYRIVVRQTLMATQQNRDRGSGSPVLELVWMAPFTEPMASPSERSGLPQIPVSPAQSAAPKPPRTKVYAAAEVDVRPEYPGGKQALRRYIKEHLRYPPEERAAGDAGKVVVGFLVTSTGTVREVAVKTSSNIPSFDNEAKRVVGSLGGWSPGEKDGRPVDTRMTWTVEFTPHN